MTKYTALIILVYNNDKNIINFIDSVQNFNTSPIKYIIVDNGSPNKNVTNNIRAYLNEKYKDKVVEYDDNFTNEEKNLTFNFIYCK